MPRSFEILAGPSMSGKTYTLCCQVLKEANLNPDSLFMVIVPDQAGNAYEKMLIELNRELYGRPGFMNIDVLGFSRFAYRVFDELGIRDTGVLEEYEKNMLVRVATSRIADQLEVYGNSVNRTGFTREVKSLISELIQYNISADELEKAASELAPGKETLGARLRDIVRIYREFVAILDNMRSPIRGISGVEDELGITIAEERLKLLARLLSGNRPCSITDGTVFIFDEYRGYTPDQLAVIAALSKRADTMRFGICIDTQIIKDNIVPAKHDIFYQSYTTMNSIKAAIGTKPEIRLADREWSDTPDRTEHLSRYIFRYPSVEYKGEEKESLRVYSAKNIEDEIRLVAEEIREEIQQGLRYKDIVVVTGDMEAVDNVASKIFRDYDIPVFFDYSRKLRKNPYTEALLRVLNIVDKDFDYDSIFGYVKTGVAHIKDRDGLNSLENYCLRTGIRGRKLWEKPIRPFGRRITEEMKQSCAVMNKVREQILESISPLMELGRTGEKVSSYIAALRSIMDMLDFEGNMESSAEVLEELGLMSDARVMRSLYSVLDRVMTETDELLGEEVMSIHDFTEILQSGINEITVGVIPPTLDCVSVCDIDRSRIVRAEAVHFINVNDGVVPRKHSPGRILSDRDKEEVSRLLMEQGEGKALADGTARQNVDELFLIYQILSKAAKRLTISYSELGRDGTSLEPSHIIERIKRLFPGLTAEPRRPKELGGTGRSDRPQYISWIRDALEILHGTSGEPGEEYHDRLNKIARYIGYTNEDGGITDLDIIRPGLEYSNAASPVSSTTMTNINLRLSVSKLETYASCPYKYFLQYVLELRDRPEKKIEYYDVGNVIHRALELLFTEMREIHDNDWSGIKVEELKEMAAEYVDQAWNESEMDSDVEADGKTEKVHSNLKSLAMRSIETIRDHIVAGDMKPTNFEQYFTAEFTAHRPDGTEVPVVLEGKIDRLDTKEEDGKLYIRVIDLKTGSQKFSPEEIREGTDVQLVVYSKIVTEILKQKFGKDAVIPAGIYYFHVADPIVRPTHAPAQNSEPGSEGEIKAYSDERAALFTLSGVSDSDPLVRLNLHDKGLVDEEQGKLNRSSKIIVVNAGSDGSLKDSSVVLDGEGFDGVEDYAAMLIREKADSILSGDFRKAPIEYIATDEGHGTCTYCRFRAVCRFGEYAGEKKLIPSAKGSVSGQLNELSECVKKKKKTEFRRNRFIDKDK